MSMRDSTPRWMLTFVVCVAFAQSGQGRILYVDDDATGANNGSSWARAYRYLQDALANASGGDVIRVAQGVYKPDLGVNVRQGNREATFQLINGVTIMGGYAGLRESNPGARNVEVYKTILSGDLNGDDGADFANNDENSYHVVTGSGTDAGAVLDGVTITAGNANGAFPHNCGGGVLNLNGHPTVNNCVFVRNVAGWGGGMRNRDGSQPTVTNCTFSGNRAGEVGGGMANYQSTPVVTDCMFDGNSAKFGGGTFNEESSPSATNCTFTGNSAVETAGGMYNTGNSRPTLTNCTFDRNSAKFGGGMLNNESDPNITECAFTGNSAETSGGGMYNDKSNPKMRQCNFDDNMASFGGGMYNEESNPGLAHCTFNANSAEESAGGMRNYKSNPEVAGCMFEGNTAKFGGGMYNSEQSSPAVTGCMFTSNSAETSGGGMYNSEQSSPAVTGSTFTDNVADYGGGIYNYKNNPTVTDCTFTGNSVEVHGGGVYNNESGLAITGCTFINNMATNLAGGMANWRTNSEVSNCTFSNNSARLGGGMFSEECRPELTDCLFENNVAAEDGGGVYSHVADPKLRHCTFTGNQAAYGAGMYNYRSGDDFRWIVLDGCIFQRNLATDDGGGIYNDESNPVVTNCTFSNNSAESFAGGMYNSQSDPNIANCAFEGNSAKYAGGAIRNYDGSNPTVVGCIFNGNSGQSGGAVANNASFPRLLNCTFAHNTASIFGGAIDSYKGENPAILSNCILWDNAAPYGGEIALRAGASITLSYCDIQCREAKIYSHEGGIAYWGEGNVDVDPALTPDGHLKATSPCMDIADSNAVPLDIFDLDRDGDVNEPTPFDIDGDPRFVDNPGAVNMGTGVVPFADIGADEFLDSDQDGLPDWWEQKYFGDSTVADPGDDPDGDDLANLEEYELYSSNPVAFPVSVDASAGQIRTLQEGIDAADDGDTVLVPAGTYKGEGNRNIDFRGKSVVLKAVNGPEATTIDCEYSACGFNFHSGESPATAVIGFTITRGWDYWGGAISCAQSHPQIYDCILRDNAATYWGDAIYCENSVLTLADCVISGNERDGVCIRCGGARIEGVVELVSNDWLGYDLVLTGPGTLHMRSGVTFNSDDSRIRCNMSGPGTIAVSPNSELIIEGVADVNLADGNTNGTIKCNGLLRARDSARISNADINVTRARFEGDVNICNNVITAEAGAPYGQFFIEGSVKISGNDIHADGDRYMDVDRSVFDGLVENNRIYVTITEGRGQTRGGLLELRGQDDDRLSKKYGLDQFLCQVDPGTIPAFDPNSWTLEKLILVDGAKLNLTNRFDFQAPYDSGGEKEVLYIRDLILGEGAVLNTSFNRVYYETIVGPETPLIVNVPLLGFSLNMITFDNEIEFSTRVSHNNYEHPENSEYDRKHVRWVTGLEPDPNGVMRMYNMLEPDPDSPQSGEVIYARAKGLFAKADEDRILVMFEYLFETPDPDTELVIYLSDVPELLTHTDPSRADHYVEVARLPNPPSGRPGSAGSGRFGTFHQYVSGGHLDFIKGTRIELELIGADKASVVINNWDPQVHCTGICMDLNKSDFADEEDLVIVMAECGKTAGLLDDATNSRSCLDGVFSTDGYVDSFDAVSGDWALSNPDRELVLNLCGVPLGDSAIATMSVADRLKGSSGHASVAGLPSSLGDLLIAGKKNTNGDFSMLIEDRLYTFGRDGQYIDSSDFPSDRCNVRLVKGLEDQIYQINSETGILRLDKADGVIIPPGRAAFAREPRYNEPATIYIGIQKGDSGPFGRPILDAAFDRDYAYVVPVVVKPKGQDPYVAAAKLQLNPTPYEVVQLYDDPDANNPADNRHLNHLREIEIDKSGNLYVLNVHSLNESDILWKYRSDGSLLKRLDLGNPKGECHLPDPIAMHVSDDTGMVYLASAQYDEDPYLTTLYVFSKEQLVLERLIKISGMQHVIGLAEEPAGGSLWAVGYNIECTDAAQPPFYVPCLAEIPSSGSADARAVGLLGSHDLGLPMSVVWTGTGVQ